MCVCVPVMWVLRGKAAGCEQVSVCVCVCVCVCGVCVCVCVCASDVGVTGQSCWM